MKFSKSSLGVLLGGVLVGFGFGWALKPTSERGIEEESAKSSRAKVTSEKRSRRSEVSKWVARLDREDAVAMAKEVGDDELGLLLEEVMAGFWGGVGRKDVERIHALIGEWVERDQSGCLTWARGLEARAWREVGLLAIVNTLGESDPVSALQIYCEIDRITSAAFSNVDGEYWEEALTSIAAESGPEGVAAILNHLPMRPTVEESGFNGGLIMDFNAPTGFDYEELMRLSPEAGRQDGAARHLTVELLGDWAKQDPDGAWDHVMQRMKEGDSMSWGPLLGNLEKTESREIAVRTAMEAIQEMPLELQGEYLQTSWMWESVLDAIPEMDERMELLSRMERVSDDGPFGTDRWEAYAHRIGMDSDVLVKNLEEMQKKQ